jgi:hypothetical protein
MPSFIKPRSQRAKPPKWLWGVVVVLLVVTLGVFAAISQRKPLPVDPNAVLHIANCNGDVVCAGSRVQAAAELACTPFIEEQARYGTRWIDDKLPLGRWSQRSEIIASLGQQRVIQYEGEGALFQNGFGAWKKLKYECDYDVLERKALSARIFE